MSGTFPFKWNVIFKKKDFRVTELRAVVIYHFRGKKKNGERIIFLKLSQNTPSRTVIRVVKTRSYRVALIKNEYR